MIDNTTRRALLQAMLRIRLAERRIADLYAEQEMRCPTHLAIGQEAIPAAISLHLAETDLVFSGHRSHGHYLAKGGDMAAMFAELYGKATGCAAGKGGSQHLIDLSVGFMGAAPILASTISVGVGAAWAARLDGSDQVSVIYFGDGATEEGAFHESMNFAAVHRLAVIFVCENNLYSVHSAMEIRQPDRAISALGTAHGMTAMDVDGNDAGAVSRVAAAALVRARSGQGPTFIEAKTYRWMEHCGPNDDIPLGYRTGEELDDWKARDPITRLAEGGATGLLEDLTREIEAEIDAAVAFAKDSPFPEIHELEKHLLPA